MSVITCSFSIRSPLLTYLIAFTAISFYLTCTICLIACFPRVKLIAALSFDVDSALSFDFHSELSFDLEIAQCFDLNSKTHCLLKCFTVLNSFECFDYDCWLKHYDY